MSVAIVLVGGRRDGRTMTVNELRGDTINFGFLADTPPVPIGGAVPAPLPKPESYRADGVDDEGRHRFVYVEPAS